MGADGFVASDQAKQLVRSAMNAVANLRDSAFWKIGADDLLSLGQELETLSRDGVCGQGAPRGEKPHIVIYLHWDHVKGEIAKETRESGFPMSTRQARRYLCDAQILPVVLGGGSEILDVGRSRRTSTRGMRRAIKVRDRGCVWSGCDRPANWCDVHPVDWFVRDLGETNVHTGVLLCGFHHDEIHQAQWTIRFAADGHPEPIPRRGSIKANAPEGIRCTIDATSSTRSTVTQAAWINFAPLGRVGQKSSLSSMPGKLIHARRGGIQAWRG